MIRKENAIPKTFHDEKVMENEKAAENHIEKQKTMGNRWKRRNE